MEREPIASTVESISRQMPVALLNTPFSVDDHADIDACRKCGLTIELGHMTPEFHYLRIAKDILGRLRGASRVLLDVTASPAGRLALPHFLVGTT